MSFCKSNVLIGKLEIYSNFLEFIKNIQNRYFGSESGSKSKVNMSASYTISEAIEVVADTPQLVYNKVLITKGDLASFQNPSAVPQAGQVLRLSGEDNSIQGNAKATDRANAVCYCEELGTFEIFESLTDHSSLTFDITLAPYYSGKEVHVWMYFNNIEETLACNSPYLGMFTLL